MVDMSVGFSVWVSVIVAVAVLLGVIVGVSVARRAITVSSRVGETTMVGVCGASTFIVQLVPQSSTTTTTIMLREILHFIILL